MPINPLSLPTLLDWGPWAPLVVYATYLLRYFLVRKLVQTGLYNNLVADLLDSVGREAALKKIGAPNRWHAFYRNSLDGLLRFFDRWFGDGREGWLSPRALHVCYLLAFGYEAGIHDGVIDIPPHHRNLPKEKVSALPTASSSALDVLAWAPGKRLFQNAKVVDDHLRAERDAWKD